MTRIRLMAACSACIVVALTGGAASAQDASAQHSHGTAGAAHSPFGAWGFDLAGRDTSVKPGDDFNEYANGTYLRTTEIPADKSRFGPFDVLYENAQAQLKSIIETSAANPANENARKVGALYASFMDEVKIEQLGATPLAADLAAVKAVTDHAGMARLMGESHSGFGGSLFGIDVFEDLKNPNLNSAYLGQGSLGLPDRDYYLKADFAAQREAYLAYLATTLTAIGWADPAKTAADILAFETKVADKQWTTVERRQIDKLYNPAKASDLATLAPGFDWAGFLAGAQVSDVDTLVLMENTAIPAIAQVFADTPIETLKAWQAFNVVDQASPYLSKAFVDARFDFRGKTLRGQPENRPRWNRGVALVDGQLGEVLAQEYVRLHFPASSKAQMEALVGNIRDAMTERLKTLDWMSEPTREQALYKMSKFGVKIGYPDKWRSYDGLELKADDLYGNVERSSAFEWAYKRGKIGKPVDPLEWGMTPQTVNAYYNPPRNEIVFPAAILQAPFFDPNADPAVNYGGIGAVIGHEITHGFDDQGRKSDGDGVLRDWWTPEDAARFEARAKVLGDIYDKLEPIPGVHVNGDLTMGENIADLGGLLLALDAYHKSLNGQPAPVIDGLTGDQRVFLGWAQVWREKSREAALKEQLTTDPHSPGPVRAATSPRNIEAWYAAFGVSPDQKEYIAPEARARIW
ncbi:M13 family metallopeptidase [Brevundimonas vesicularis]|uniref:M13 family peptidase n=1 Tax=Brevundimonas vesicularis TaxID=41276 RepID=A0A1Z3UBI8_BREVE|nr:M13-type metalloendopeptidase [Brevundimonas vesicularis]ASE40592.1 M13 family peptidase [Brevundimonas vesicularis]MDX2334520.1 M13 family peptidase [Brevundimonas vesicularis]